MYNQEKQDRFSIVTTPFFVALPSKNHKNLEEKICFDNKTCHYFLDIIFLILIHRENKQECRAGPAEQNRS